MEKILNLTDEIVKTAIKNGTTTDLANSLDDTLKKEFARKYFLLTGEDLPDIDSDSYGFSIQELLDHNKIKLTDHV